MFDDIDQSVDSVGHGQGGDGLGDLCPALVNSLTDTFDYIGSLRIIEDQAKSGQVQTKSKNCD